MDREQFAEVFRVGDEVESGSGVNRRNAAKLRILKIEENLVRYQSIASERSYLLRFRELEILIDRFKHIDPARIVDSVNGILREENFQSDFTTETYAYGIARAFLERPFLSEGERYAEADIAIDRPYNEGSRVLVSVERIERDASARLACIGHYGAKCQACGFDFERTYGKVGRGFIHVHHLRQLSLTSGPYNPDPVNDLVPLCPNCHAMVHRSKQMLNVDELRSCLREQSQNSLQ